MIADPDREVVGRFAPSPTGDLHFGSLLAALASYCDARSRGGSWQLRIDDIDGPRTVAGSADAIQRTLEHYGFQWDGEVRYQSTRLQHYRDALAMLVDQRCIFACNCSRRLLPSGKVYPGNCRSRIVTTLPPLDTRNHHLHDHALRMRMLGSVSFDDAVQGKQRIDLARDVGDSVIWRRDGLVSYALACAVDDASLASHVVRGADLLEATGVQLGIMQALQLRVPHYAHIPVARDARGDKLSKHSRAMAIDRLDQLATLLRAWSCLGQSPMEAISVEDFWTQAFGQWQMNRVPRAQSVSVAP